VHIVIMRFLTLARMVLDHLPDIRRNIPLTGRQSATRLASPAASAAALMHRNLLHYLIHIRDAARYGGLVLC
jgi:hypothetical protein